MGIKIHICLDCLWFTNYGTVLDGAPNDLPERIHKRWGDADIVSGESPKDDPKYPHDGDLLEQLAFEGAWIAPEPAFSWRPCECCGNDLGGERHVARVYRVRT